MYTSMIKLLNISNKSTLIIIFISLILLLHIGTLNFFEAEKNLKKYGKTLVSNLPDSTTNLLMKLCTTYTPTKPTSTLSTSGSSSSAPSSSVPASSSYNKTGANFSSSPVNLSSSPKGIIIIIIIYFFNLFCCFFDSYILV